MKTKINYKGVEILHDEGHDWRVITKHSLQNGDFFYRTDCFSTRRAAEQYINNFSDCRYRLNDSKTL